jgi:tetratricopeptide (TPR) repeat protein
MENPRPRRPAESSDQPASERQTALPVRSQASRTRVMKTAFLLGVLSAAIMGTMAGFFAMKASSSPPVIVPEPIRRRPETSAFNQAKNLIREGKWVEARARLVELQALAPDYPGIGDYLARVEQEIPNQEHLTAAKAALAARMLGVAKGQLDQISPDTTMFELVHQLKRELKDTADARVREAQALLDAGQREQAVAILGDVVAAFPEDRLARASFERAQSVSVVDSGSAAWNLVVRDFMQGELSSAVVLAEACAPAVPRCKSGLEDLKEFSRLLKKMEDLDPDQLNRMVVLDRQITGALVPSRATEKVRLRQANILYKNAAAARARGAWARAMEFARLTLQADPGHRGAAIIREEMRSKAWETYLRASQVAPTDLEESLKLFRQVMAMTPPEDELHQKARSWIDKLQR